MDCKVTLEWLLKMDDFGIVSQAVSQSVSQAVSSQSVMVVHCTLVLYYFYYEREKTLSTSQFN